MKIELKKIKYSLEFSEETNMFSAEIYVNGVNVGYAKNDGHGGCTEYNPHYSATPEQRQLFNEAEEYCKSLPPVKFHSTELPMDMELYIDEYIQDYIEKKEDKKNERKLQNNIKKGIVFGTKNQYEVVYWKNYSLDVLLETPLGKSLIIKKIMELKIRGHNILNTNLPEDVLNSVE